jgi:hypothetical protein
MLLFRVNFRTTPGIVWARSSVELACRAAWQLAHMSTVNRPSTCWNGPVEVPQKEQGGPTPRLPCSNAVREDTASDPCGETIHGIRIRTECGCPGLAQRVEFGKVSAGAAGRSAAATPTSTGPTGRHEHLPEPAPQRECSR